MKGMNDNEIGSRIRELRQKRKITQSRLADYLGYSGNTKISKLENGTQSLSAAELSIIAKALKTTPNYLLGFETEQKEYTAYRENHTNQNVTIRKLTSQTTKFEWSVLLLLLILPLIIIRVETDTGFVLSVVLLFLLIIGFFVVSLRYILNRKYNVKKITTDLNNYVVYSHKWSNNQIKKHNHIFQFSSFFLAVMTFLFLIVFSGFLQNIFKNNSITSLSIMFILMTFSISKIFFATIESHILRLIAYFSRIAQLFIS
jgi:transcriptional regulator with XRE-family HTH domain